MYRALLAFGLLVLDRLRVELVPRGRWVLGKGAFSYASILVLLGCNYTVYAIILLLGFMLHTTSMKNSLNIFHLAFRDGYNTGPCSTSSCPVGQSTLNYAGLSWLTGCFTCNHGYYAVGSSYCSAYGYGYVSNNNGGQVVCPSGQYQQFSGAMVSSFHAILYAVLR